MRGHGMLSVAFFGAVSAITASPVAAGPGRLPSSDRCRRVDRHRIDKILSRVWLVARIRGGEVALSCHIHCGCDSFLRGSWRVHNDVLVPQIMRKGLEICLRGKVRETRILASKC